MKYDIAEFEKRVEEGFLRKSEKGDLVLYGYTDKCTFDRAWDEYTRVARGLILNKNTGQVVAKPFPKFFNLGEMEETFLTNLPTCGYKAYEKVDGSLGIIFYYDGEWQVSTRGSFYSDQAVMGKEILAQYDMSLVPKTLTLLAEIIYPENKIIVNYGQDRMLVLLGSFDTNGHEYSHITLQGLADYTGMPLAKAYDYTIQDMITLQEHLKKDEEGFVVRFDNGLRVKIKGKEYLRIAKLMSSLSPLALWETMKDGKVDTFYLQQLPEELRADYEPYVVQLEQQYELIKLEIAESVNEVLQATSPNGFGDNWRKDVGLYLNDHDLKHSSAVFPVLLNNNIALSKYIMKQIRPTGNAIRSFE